MNTQDIEDLLAETPEAVIYLYRLVDTHNFKVNGKDCDPLCDYLLSERSPLKNIPVNLTYAGKSERDELGWIELDYRSDDRNGYPKNCKDKSEFDKKNLNDISETHLAMRIFRQGRKNDKIGKIPDLGYILDYQMPIGGKNSKLYRINRENKNMYPEKGRDYRAGQGFHHCRRYPGQGAGRAHLRIYQKVCGRSPCRRPGVRCTHEPDPAQADERRRESGHRERKGARAVSGCGLF